MNYNTGYIQPAGKLMEQSLRESNDQFLEFEAG